MSLPVERMFTVDAFETVWTIRAELICGGAYITEVSCGGAGFMPVWMLDDRVAKSLSFHVQSQLLAVAS